MVIAAGFTVCTWSKALIQCILTALVSSGRLGCQPGVTVRYWSADPLTPGQCGDVMAAGSVGHGALLDSSSRTGELWYFGGGRGGARVIVDSDDESISS